MRKSFLKADETTLFEKLTTPGHKLNWKEWIIDKIVGLSLIAFMAGSAFTFVVLPVLVSIAVMVALIKVAWFIIFQWT